MDSILIICAIYLTLVFVNGEVWYPYQFDSGNGNREELVITKVGAVADFQMKENVEKWRSLSVKDRAFALGLCEKQIAILEAVLDEENNGFKTTINYLPVNHTIVDITLLARWNSKLHQDEVVAIVATTNNETNHPNAELTWYKLAKDTLQRTATLNLQKTVTEIITFRNEEKYYLIVFNERTAKFASADFYEFQLKEELDYWLIQSIKLDVPTSSAAIVEHSAKLYLTITQESEINIFALEKNRFVPYKKMAASKVRSVTPFKIGFQAYIAIDGYASGIYKFPELAREDLSEANLEGIDFWLSIPARTFKEEEILIAQRSLDFGTHKSLVVEVVLHNAGEFSVHDEVACDYFGDVTHGMNCLIEENDVNGVKGSAALIIGHKIGVLVPGYGAPSRLFMIYASLKQIESPIEREIKKIDQYKAVLEQKMNNQINKFKSIDENLVGEALKWDPKLSLSELTLRIEKLQEAIAEMKSKIQNIAPQEELQSKVTFKTLIVNGLVEVLGVSNLEQINTDDFNDKFNFSDVVRRDDLQKIEGFKTFTDLEVENLSFETANDIPAENFAFNSSGLLEIEGDVVFDGNVVVRGDVEVENFNDFDLAAEVVTVNQEFVDPLEFESLLSDALQVKEANKFRLHDNYPDVLSGNQDSIENATLKNIFIPGNVTIHRVNGENLTDLIGSLCLTNAKTYIPGATYISGNVSIVEALDTEFLNNFLFPAEFVFANSLEFSEITGHKTFANNLNIKELSVQDRINNVDPHKIVTLSEDQEIPGNFVFEDLTITEMLEVDGDVEQSSDFLSKPTLEDTQRIITNANFKTLEVEGDIIIRNIFNGTNFTSYLSDVVYKSDENITINSLKTMREVTVSNNLNVLSNEINNIEIASLVTKDSEGILKLGTINGGAVFDYLYSNGTYNSVNITQLDKQSVRLNGTQFIAADLVFENPLVTEELEITKRLNDVPAEDYMNTRGDRALDDLIIDAIIADEFHTNSISGELTNFNLTDFEQRRLSYSKEQVVSGDWKVEKSKVEKFIAQFVNGNNFEDLFNANNFAGKVSDMLASGKLKIKELSVEDSLNISRVDGVDFNKILAKCISTHENGRKLNLSLDGEVNFAEIGFINFNGVAFKEFLANIIYKNESDVNILGRKLYKNGFTINNYVTTPLLYNVNVQNIMHTVGNQTIHSPLILEGDVFIKEGEIGESLNGFTMEYLEKTFESREDTYFINGDVNFRRLTRTDKLNLETANNKNVADVLLNLIDINEDNNLTGTLTFNKGVVVKSNLAADEINGINLSTFKEEVVLIRNDGSIEVPVIFKEPVFVKEVLEVERDLDSQIVMGVDLQKWLEDAVFINEGKINGEIHFEEAQISSLQTNFLNGIDLSTLINLRTNENINQTLNFKEVSSFNEIRVKNLVNGYNLEDEYLNTVLSERIQDVHSRVTFASNVLARRFLDVKSLINGNNLTKMVTTDSDQLLNASYEFSNRTTFTSDIFVEGLINGVNLTEWSISGVKKFTAKPQIIESPWNITKNLTFRNNVVGNSSINGLDLGKMVDVVESRRVFKYSVESDLLMQFRKTCRDINNIVSITKQQIYLFDYLDYYQIINFESNIKTVQYFQYQNMDYILVSREQSCTSTLFVWSQSTFKPIKDMETGKLSQIIVVSDADNLFLVTRGDPNETSCEIDGTNIWKVAVDELKHLYKIEAHILLQESLKPGTFYAMSKNKVEEYRIITDIESVVTKVRRWDVSTDNSAFVPRGLSTGLALRNGSNLMQMDTEDPIVVDLEDFNSVVIGDVFVKENRYLPSRSSGEVVVMNAGRRGRSLALISQPLDMSIKGKLDFIKIYEDINKGSLFHSIPSYKPTSLLTLKFGENGEDLLFFLENQEKLQIYQYKGIEGFKHRLMINAEGSQLQSLDLPYGAYPKRNTFIALINKNTINLLLVVMKGDQINDDNVDCNL